MTDEADAHNCDMAIVGASHAGLAMALALARGLGDAVRLVLVERSAAAPSRVPPVDPRAFAIAAGGQRMLAALGVWERVADHAEPVTRIEVTDSSLSHAIRPVLLSYDNRLETGGAGAWIVPAAPLLTALRDAVAAVPGIEVLAPAQVTGLATSTTGAKLALADGRIVAAPLVIAADGGASAMRDLAGIKTVAWRYAQCGIAATIAHARPHGGRAVQHFLPGGPFAILPLPGNRCCITWSEQADEADRIMGLDDAAFLAEVERRFDHRLGAIALEGGRAAWPLGYRMARSLIGDRLALVGDAAHGVHPIAGQGLNLGLRDVAALAESVADGMRMGLDPGDGTILDRYAQWRRFDNQMSAAGYDALNRLFSNDIAPLRVLRDAGLGLVDRLPGLKRLLVAEAAGITGDVPKLLTGALP